MAKRKPSNINLLFAVDKPTGCTSHDVVATSRRSLGERRVGHAGTLDPLATGVMLLGVGQATRLLGMLTLDCKSYVATISFGCETNTDDSEGEITREVPCAPELTDAAFACAALEKFMGPQLQVPPAFSAISVNGVRAYKSAREGREVELPARPIEVYKAQLLSIEQQAERVDWLVAFEVSKGTYIRSLARDIGRAVQGAAHISALRRTSSGLVELVSAMDVNNITPESVRAQALNPLKLLGLPAHELPESVLADVLCGRRIRFERRDLALSPEGECGLVISGCLRAIAYVEDGYYQMRHVFPQGIEGVR